MVVRVLITRKIIMKLKTLKIPHSFFFFFFEIKINTDISYHTYIMNTLTNSLMCKLYI